MNDEKDKHEHDANTGFDYKCPACISDMKKKQSGKDWQDKFDRNRG